MVGNMSGLNGEAITQKDLVTFKNYLIYEISELLDEKLALQASQSGERHTLRSRDVRRALGISASTLQSYRISGLLRAKKVGGTYYYDPRDLKKFQIK
ncbi:hypothetical protein ABIE26_002938 [Pedobacter africanus]|uniref:helix-turn-helix domain-containing protein n=1 Tax=Pedobacter africanus TaxID=151894 RepID=UPI00339AB4EB